MKKLLYILTVAAFAAGGVRADIPPKGNLQGRLAAYLAADPAGRGVLMLEDAEGLVPVRLTFMREPDAVDLSALADGGVRFYDASGGILHYGLIYPARCGDEGLRTLDAAPGLAAVSAPPMQKPVPMLDWTRVDIGAEPSWYHHPEVWPLTGEGITVADIDSEIELFHPTFFRPDGGYYAWIDVDADGVFEPGTDAVDLDGSGDISDQEIVQLVDAAAWRLYTWPPVTLPDASYDGVFTPGLDWLYLDMNGDGRRDLGYKPDDPVFPITEETPAYGEPLFIADDMDRSGTLDPDEKLIRLGTSKFKAVLQGPGYQRFVRGENLIEYGGGGSNWDMEHATQALGIVGGGVPGLARYAGIAPDAELVLAAYTNLDYMVCLMWVLEQEPDIVLHEAGSWVDVTLDGASEEEQTMDLSTVEDGVIHINPSGNLGGSQKHARVDVGAAAEAEAGLVVPDWGGHATMYWTMMTFLWRQPGAELRFEMCNPDDLCDDFTDAGHSGISIWDDSTYVATYRSASSRNTQKLTAFIGDYYQTQLLPVGTWRLRIVNPSGEDVTAHLYITDNIQDWSYGMHWSDDVATDLYTVTYPGTADYSLNVSAYAGHGEEDWGDPVRRGSYRWYSSQGPRIDEVANMDVAAPDNPITSAPPLWDGMTWASFLEFGGTSGAGPHVAGGVALILQADRTLTGELMRDAVRSGALADADVGDVPNHQWGWGKFRVDRTVFGESVTPGQPPVLALTAPEGAVAGEPASIVPVAQDPDGDVAGMVIRWDMGYDGTWDTDWIAVEAFEHVFEEAGRAEVKAMVRDGQGLTAQAAVSFDVGEVPAETGEEGEAVPDAGDDAVPEAADADAGEAGPVEASGGACGCAMVL
jgi:subtilisin family serine protease